MADQAPTTVLVTGGSGFVASHLILQLLAAGHDVRTTLRSPDKAAAVRETLQSADSSVPLDKLSFFTADLTKDEGWADAVNGCTYVHHLASPFPGDDAKDDDEVVVPARDGTVRVLKAAKSAGVKRVVITSSFAAIAYGHGKKDTFNEQDWSLEKDLPPFHKSKLLAEKAAWDFAKQNALEITVINSVGVLGPVLSGHISSGVGVIKSLLDGSLPGCPRLYNNFVDVRDLSKLHITAMTHPKAGGERFIASDEGEPRALLDVANIIRTGRPDKSGKVPNRQLPDWTVKATALANPKLKGLLPQLGVQRIVKTTKVKDTLGWSTRKVEDTICETVDSLVKQGVVTIA